jgi:CDP-glucose 4,6-dehydratase
LGDICDYEKLADVVDKFRPEIIFHLAAQPLVRESFLTPRQTFETNMLGTLNVLEVIRENAGFIKVGVIITSDKCYDNVEWLYGYRENDRLGGDDPYSGSKGAAELIAKSYMSSFFKDGFPNICTTRAGNVIGGGDWAKDRIIPDLIKAWSLNQKVEIRNPRSTRPWQHVLEPLSGYLCVGAELFEGNNAIRNQAFNFGPNSNVNKNVGELINELALHYSDAPGWNNLENKDSLMKESNLLKLSCDKANILLNWYPNLDFSNTVKFTAEWYIRYSAKKNDDDVYNLTLEQINNFTLLANQNKIKWAMR